MAVKKQQTGNIPSVEEALKTTGATPLANQRWERFALGIANGLGPADAYVQAGYKTKNRTRASRKGCVLRKRSEVQRRIAFLKNQVRNAALSDRQKVVRELERIGFADIRDVVAWDEHGRPLLKASNELGPDEAAAVRAIKYRKRQQTESFDVETHDKLSALKELAHIHGAYPKADVRSVTVVIVAPPKMTQEEWIKRYGRQIKDLG